MASDGYSCVCGHLACKDCHGLQYASRQRDVIARKRLQAAKLRLSLGSLSTINEPLPPKPEWQRQRTYKRIRKQELEAQAKARHFRKPIDTHLFAYSHRLG